MTSKAKLQLETDYLAVLRGTLLVGEASFVSIEDHCSLILWLLLLMFLSKTDTAESRWATAAVEPHPEEHERNVPSGVHIPVPYCAAFVATPNRKDVWPRSSLAVALFSDRAEVATLPCQPTTSSCSTSHVHPTLTSHEPLSPLPLPTPALCELLLLLRPPPLPPGRPPAPPPPRPPLVLPTTAVAPPARTC